MTRVPQTVLLSVAIFAITCCSCRGPMQSGMPYPPADSQMAYSALSQDSNTIHNDSGSSIVSSYPQAARKKSNGVVTASAVAEQYPIEQIETPQGTPLPMAAYPPWAPPAISQPWPQDEYLRDGGDEGLPVGVGKEGEVRGLEMDDTVAHYDTLDGRTIVTPSNEVYIYSPRFAAVRQVVGLVATEQKERLSDIYLNSSVATPTVAQKISAAKQQIRLENEISARPAQAFLMKQGDGALSSVIGPRGFHGGFKPYENLSIVRQGTLVNTDRLILADSAVSAVAWSNTQVVQVILDRQNVMVAVQNEQAESIMVATAPPGNPKLRIVKLASTPDAKPGEEVWFTIRFDNVGNQPIGNVTIMDSLSTRLEYVAGSAQCSREATFASAANEGDSLVIRCDLTNPLEVGKGGIIRFKCIVR